MAKFVVCSNCGEEFDAELFPVCPFCLTPVENEIKENIKTDVGETEVKTAAFNDEENDSSFSAVFYSVDDDTDESHEHALSESEQPNITITDKQAENNQLINIDEKEEFVFNYSLSTRCINFLKKDQIDTVQQLRDFMV